ncbi:peptidoglycan bridge formation glycyltransferase FemA/FemB family protein [Candidatus Parcubacteria bacterium]|nr:MAG: peptidoglycan bridge formation glycyltransferase FemA/FemB family protein [Candidatus Parcubacteria bacterium]
MDFKDKNIKYYSYGFIFPQLLRKYWFWFAKPFDVKGAAMVNFFSYEKYDVEGFKMRAGLTTIIDLELSLDELWSKTRKKFIQKQINRGERNGIIVKRDPNFGQLKKIYKEFRKTSDLPKDNINIYKKNCDLMAAYYKDEMIAGGIFVSNGVYMRALVLASVRKSKDSQQREIVGQANRMLIWETIKYAKDSQHKHLDLGGISPNSDKEQLRSLAEFKEAFGGERKDNYYYFKVYSPIIKWWMRLRGFTNV